MIQVRKYLENVFIWKSTLGLEGKFKDCCALSSSVVVLLVRFKFANPGSCFDGQLLGLKAGVEGEVEHSSPV